MQAPKTLAMPKTLNILKFEEDLALAQGLVVFVFPFAESISTSTQSGDKLVDKFAPFSIVL